MKTFNEEIEDCIQQSKYDEAAELVAQKLDLNLTIIAKDFKKHFNEDTHKRWVYKCMLSREDKSFVFDFGSSLGNSNKQSNKYDLMLNDEIVEIYAGFGYKTKKDFSASVKFNIKKEFLESIPNSILLAQAKLFQKNAEENAQKYNEKLSKQFKNRTITKDTYEKLSITLNGLKEAESYIPMIQKAIVRKIEDLKKEQDFTNIAIEDTELPTIYDILCCLTKYDPGTFENFCGDFGYDEDSRKAYKTYETVKEEYMNMCSLFSDKELELLSLIN